MTKLKGKQIENNTINQNNFNVETGSITGNTHVTNKDYTITRVNDSMGGIYQSKLNTDMTANNATIGEKATDKHVYEFPRSNIMVKVNNIYVNAGETADCYFSPDGSTIRDGGNAQKGDYLYWNSNKYDLESDDEIDFIYLVNYEYYTLSAGTTIELDPTYNNLVVEYTGGDDTTMTVTIDGVDFLVGNSGGSFVWDIGGSNEYIFTSENQSIEQDVNGEDYTIWFDGFGSLIFSIKKGNYKSYTFEILEDITITNISIEYAIELFDDLYAIINNNNDPQTLEIYELKNNNYVLKDTYTTISYSYVIAYFNNRLHLADKQSNGYITMRMFSVNNNGVLTLLDSLFIGDSGTSSGRYYKHLEYVPDKNFLIGAENGMTILSLDNDTYTIKKAYSTKTTNIFYEPNEQLFYYGEYLYDDVYINTTELNVSQIDSNGNLTTIDSFKYEAGLTHGLSVKNDLIVLTSDQTEEIFTYKMSGSTMVFVDSYTESYFSIREVIYNIPTDTFNVAHSGFLDSFKISQDGIILGKIGEYDIYSHIMTSTYNDKIVNFSNDRIQIIKLDSN